VVALDPVVGVLVGAVPCRWQQRLQHARVDRRLIGGDLNRRDLGRADRRSAELEQGLGGGFSCQQSHGSDTVTANATVPPPFCLVVDGVDFHI
jgi:hypothetical protein